LPVAAAICVRVFLAVVHYHCLRRDGVTLTGGQTMRLFTPS